MPLTLLLLLVLLMAAFAQEDNWCRQGTYGNNCELKCPDQCRPFQTFPCDKITGQCSEGCNNGYYGDQCDKRCPCPSGICYQQTGDCFRTVTATSTATLNKTDKVSRTTASPVHTNHVEGVAAGWRTIAIILIVFIIFLFFGGVMMFLYVRFKKKKSTLTGIWNGRFSKAAHADVSRGEEKETKPVDSYAMSTEGEHLLQNTPDVEAAGRQFEESQPLGDQAKVKDKENQKLLVSMPKEEKALSLKVPDIEAAGGQCEETKPLDDPAEKKPLVLKGSTDVEDLRQENQRLKEEDKEKQRLLVSKPKEEKVLSQKEPDIEAAGGQCEETKSLGDQAEEKTQVPKGSTEIEELRQKNIWLKDEKDRAEAKCEEMKKHIKNLEFQDKENQRLLGLPNNSKNHLMNNDKWLQCPNLEFDKKAVNVKVAQIDGNSVLLNTPVTGSRRNNVNRFKIFRGTTCTEPLIKSGFYQYLEVVFDIHLKQPVEEGEVVLQLGFCREEHRDKSPFIDIKKKCFVMDVVNCKIHNKICLESINNGQTEQIQELMDNVEGSKQRVMIGIRLDKYMKQIKVYDCLELRVLHKTDINIGDKIWPMFGVCDDRSASVSVQLKVGENITMEKEKKETLKSEHM